MDEMEQAFLSAFSNCPSSHNSAWLDLLVLRIYIVLVICGLISGNLPENWIFIKDSEHNCSYTLPSPLPLRQCHTPPIAGTRRSSGTVHQLSHSCCAFCRQLHLQFQWGAPTTYGGKMRMYNTADCNIPLKSCLLKYPYGTVSDKTNKTEMQNLIKMAHTLA